MMMKIYNVHSYMFILFFFGGGGGGGINPIVIWQVANTFL